MNRAQYLLFYLWSRFCELVLISSSGYRLQFSLQTASFQAAKQKFTTLAGGGGWGEGGVKAKMLRAKFSKL